MKKTHKNVSSAFSASRLPPEALTELSDFTDAVACQLPVSLTPCLVSSPHSGRDYGADFLSTVTLPFHDLQRMEDRYLDDLLSDLPGAGLSLIHARFPRSYCDPNRDWRELDKNMFHPPLDHPLVTHTDRVASGYGVIPRCALPGRAIYRRCLPAAEAAHRLENYWQPYHRALDGLLNRLQTAFGYSVLLDLHSMPPLSYQTPCDVVIGDAHGRSCAPALTNLIENLFEQAGYRVRRNVPYAGGYITRTYGRPEEGRHAVQIEICRSHYLNPATLTPSSRYARLKADLTVLLTQVGQWSAGSEGRRVLRASLEPNSSP